jgi:hypothetical protein
LPPLASGETRDLSNGIVGLGHVYAAAGVLDTSGAEAPIAHRRSLAGKGGPIIALDRNYFDREGRQRAQDDDGPDDGHFALDRREIGRVVGFGPGRWPSTHSLAARDTGPSRRKPSSSPDAVADVEIEAARRSRGLFIRGDGLRCRRTGPPAVPASPAARVTTDRRVYFTSV